MILPTATMDDVNLDNIHRMANMLDAVKPWDFDLSRWVARAAEEPKKFLGLITTDPGCGFAGCAMGWAAHMKIFPDLFIDPAHSHINYYGMGRQGTVDGFTAAAHIFGINTGLAFFFFHPVKYLSIETQLACRQGTSWMNPLPDVSPGKVAARLRRFATIITERRERAKRPDISDLRKFTKVRDRNISEIATAL